MSTVKVVKLLDAPVQINLAGGPTPTGEYDNATAYNTGDSVSYLGSSYIAIGATTGNLPTDTMFWQLLAEKGDTGATGPAGTTDHLLLTNIGTNTHVEIDSHIASTANPHSVTKTQIGLSDVDNTSDADKPVSIAQAIADSVVQSFSIQRVNHTGTQSVSTITGLAAVATSGDKADVGLGNVDNTSDLNKPVSTATQTALDGKSEVGDNVSDFVNDAGYITSVSGGDHTTLSNIGTNSHAQIDSHIGSTLNPHSVTKTQVGLGNADNTSDLDKPISTATQTALDGKQTNPFGVCKIERTGTFYATFAAAITDMQDYDTLIKLSGNHQAQAMDFTSSGLSNITIFARGSSGTANNIVGNVFLDNTCTNFEFHNIDIIAAASDSLVDTGSVGSSFNECRIDRNSGSVSVRISGASASGVRFSNCVINKDMSLNGTNFLGFITVIQCTVDNIIGNNNQGAFIDYTLINSSLQVGAASYLEVRNTIVPYIKSTQTNIGFPTFVLSNVQVRDPAAAQSSQIIEKTGTAQYSFLDVKYKIVGSTTNGTNASDAFPVNYAYNLMGKTGTALSALTRVAGMLHHNQTSTRPNWDDGTTLNELAYTSDAITTHSGLTLDDGTNPHGTTKADVGLDNVDNTSDLDKPISTATQTALNLKQDVFDPQFMSEFFDDFIMGITTNLGWTLTQTGSGAGANNSTNDGSNASQKAVGVLHLDTGGTATGRTVVSRQTNAFVLGYFEIDQRWRFRLGAISSAVQSYVIYVGIHDLTGNGTPVDGVYFTYSDSTGPNWLCVTRSNNTQTTIDSGVAADNGYNRFRIIVNSSGTEARFFINEVLVATSTTNIPNTSARLSGIALNLRKLIGTAQSNVYIDYYYHKITIPGGRD